MFGSISSLWGNQQIEEKDNAQAKGQSTVEVHVPKNEADKVTVEGTVKKKRKRRRKPKQVEQKSHDVAKESINQTPATSSPVKQAVKGQSNQLLIAMTILREKGELTKTDEGQRALNDYLLGTFGLFAEPPKKTRGEASMSQATPFTEKTWIAFKGELETFNEEFGTKRKAVLAYADSVKDQRVRYTLEVALERDKKMQRFAIAETLEQYEKVHFPFYNELLKVKAIITAKKEEVQKHLDSFLKMLENKENALKDHFTRNGDALLALENTLNPARNLSDKIVNIPTGSNDAKPYLIPVEISSTIAKEILERKDLEEESCSQFGAVHTLEKYYSEDPGTIISLLSELASTTLLKRTSLTQTTYDERNFSKMFASIERLNEEARSLLIKLRDYIGQIGDKSAKLSLSEIEDEEGLREIASKVKNSYADLFEEGNHVLQKIQLRRAELELFKEKILGIFAVMEKEIAEKDSLLNGDFENLVNELSYAMDAIKSGRSTFSSFLGTYVYGHWRFRHPKSAAAQSDGLALRKDYKAFLDSVKEEKVLFLENEKRLKAEKRAAAEAAKEEIEEQSVSTDESDKDIEEAKETEEQTLDLEEEKTVSVEDERQIEVNAAVTSNV